MAFFNKLFGARGGDKEADNQKLIDNAEKERIIKIVENGSNDELEKLSQETAKDLNNYKDTAMYIFNQMFVTSGEWLISQDAYKYLTEDNVASFREKLEKQAIDQSMGEYDTAKSLGKDESTLHTLYQISMIIMRTYRMLQDRGNCSEAFWDLIEFLYDKTKARHFKQKHFNAINNMINESKLFNEYGKLDTNITFFDLEVFAESKLLKFKFDDANLELKYRCAMSEYYKNKE